MAGTYSPLPRKTLAGSEENFMRKHLGILFILISALAGLLTPIPGTAQVQGKPDFSGIWSWPVTVNPTGPRGTGIFNKDKMAPVKPGNETLLYQAKTGDARKDEPR